MTQADNLVDSTIKLVTLPAIYQKVKSVVEDSSSSTMDLTRVIATDPAMTARILKLVNSALWGFGGRVESVSHAVTLIGTTQIHDLALACSVATVFDGISPRLIDVKKFWRDSVFRGLTAAGMARAGTNVDVGRAFTIALLGDIGHMLLYHNAPDRSSKAFVNSREQPWELGSQERELIGCDFAQVGSSLVDAWKLPACFGAAIRQQLSPPGDGEHVLESSLLHIAGMLAYGWEVERTRAACVLHIAPVAWQVLELTEACIPDVLSEVEGNLSLMERMFR